MWTNLNLAPITLHPIKLFMKSLKLGISTKIEDTDQRWGLKNTKEKIVYKILFLLKLFVKVIPSFCFTFPSCIPRDCFLYSSWNQIL